MYSWFIINVKEFNKCFKKYIYISVNVYLFQVIKKKSVFNGFNFTFSFSQQ